MNLAHCQPQRSQQERKLEADCGFDEKTQTSAAFPPSAENNSQTLVVLRIQEYGEFFHAPL